MSRQEYFEANRLNWNDRAAVHASSQTYSLEKFQDPKVLSDVAVFDQQYLGDLTGQRAIHLQCHIGTDTISLARMGAAVTALDQSEKSIDAAKQLFAATNTPGTFVVSNVYDAVQATEGPFELVYTGVGALNWLPDIDQWASVVAQLLAPGGRLYLREAHPVLWSVDLFTDTPEKLNLRFPYFETEEPMVFDLADTYTDGDPSVITNTRTYEWNHGLGEIVTAVLNQGLTLTTLDEHRSLEWQGLSHMVQESSGRWVLPPEQRDLVPLMYTLMATKP